MKKLCFAVACIALPASVAVTQAATNSNFNLNVNLGVPVAAAPAPAPPRVMLDVSPRFILSPAVGFYVSVGVPYDIVYIGADYYLNREGSWYRASHYNGPWTAVARKKLPPGLRKHKLEDIRRHRDEEYRRYEHDRGHYRGHWHEPGKHEGGKHDQGRHQGKHKEKHKD